MQQGSHIFFLIHLMYHDYMCKNMCVTVIIKHVMRMEMCLNFSMHNVLMVLKIVSCTMLMCNVKLTLTYENEQETEKPPLKCEKEEQGA